MTAGPALDRCHVGGYNCSYIPVDSPRSFDECMYILMCGTGVGFSVERENVDKLPIVNEHFEDSTTIITVADSRPGWAKALTRTHSYVIRRASTYLGCITGKTCRC
jgi:ribonucleoside-diphosphate reductase alpha chain